MQPVLDRLIRLLGWLDRAARPRCHGIADQTRLIGVACLTLALIIALPIPFGNMLPALCILAIAVGMMHRDGILLVESLMAGGAIAAGLLTIFTLLAGSLFAVATGLESWPLGRALFGSEQTAEASDKGYLFPAIQYYPPHFRWSCSNGLGRSTSEPHAAGA